MRIPWNPWDPNHSFPFPCPTLSYNSQPAVQAGEGPVAKSEKSRSAMFDTIPP